MLGAKPYKIESFGRSKLPAVALPPGLGISSSLMILIKNI
jgi:hypothetical protein